MNQAILKLFSFFLSIAIFYSCAENKIVEAKKIVIPENVTLRDIEVEVNGHDYAKGLFEENCVSCHKADMAVFLKREWENGNSWNEVKRSMVSGHEDIQQANFVGNLPDSAYNKLSDYILTAIEARTMNSFEEEPDWSGIVQSEVQSFKLDTVLTGLKVPWGLAFLPNNDILVTDINGKFYRHRDGEEHHEISGVPEVKFKGQGGLLDVEVHPDFATNQLVYLSYSKPRGEDEVTTAVLKSRLVNDELVNQEIILEGLPYRTNSLHFGSRMEFDDQGHLFITAGDRFTRDENPQNLGYHAGKVHRLNYDGSIPEDNPFVGTEDALGSVWSYGHRNPQGLVFDKNTGTLWESEHAPRGGDEINIIKKGLNYGWPIVSYGINYSGTIFTELTEREDFEPPIHYYLPSTAACGLTIVNSDKYPNWKGDLLAGSLRYQYLSRLVLDGKKVVGEERLLENIGRLRTVNMGNDGYIYIGVEDPGTVFKLVPMEPEI